MLVHFMVKDLVLFYWTMFSVVGMRLLFLTALTQTTHSVITALMLELAATLVRIVSSDWSILFIMLSGSHYSSLLPETTTIPASQNTLISLHYTVTMTTARTSSLLFTSPSSSITRALTTTAFVTTTQAQFLSTHHSFSTSRLDVVLTSTSQEQVPSFTQSASSSMEQQLPSFTKSDVAPSSSSLQHLLSFPTAKVAVTSFESLGHTVTPTHLFTSLTITQEQLKPTTSTLSKAAFSSSMLVIASFHTTPTTIPLQTALLSSSVLVSSSAGVLAKEPLNQSLIIGASSAVVIVLVILTAVLVIIGAYW